MKNFPKFLALAVAMAMAFSGSQKLSAAETAAITAVKGDKLYTQFSLFYEKNIHRTTNYRKGIFVPINTPVTFVSADSKEIEVTLPEGTELKIVNVEKYSGENINGIFNRTFGKTPVELSRFSAMEKNNIQGGTVEIGMSKDAVVAALGYPPKHQTPSLKSDQWRYWHNIFATFIVYFADDKVSRIQG